ncbi:3950_t:CDS:10, partial [Acaulospora colombiana]
GGKRTARSASPATLSNHSFCGSYLMYGEESSTAGDEFECIMPARETVLTGQRKKTAGPSRLEKEEKRVKRSLEDLQESSDGGGWGSSQRGNAGELYRISWLFAIYWRLAWRGVSWRSPSYEAVTIQSSLHSTCLPRSKVKTPVSHCSRGPYLAVATGSSEIITRGKVLVEVKYFEKSHSESRKHQFPSSRSLDNQTAACTTNIILQTSDAKIATEAPVKNKELTGPDESLFPVGIKALKGTIIRKLLIHRGGHEEPGGDAIKESRHFGWPNLSPSTFTPTMPASPFPATFLGNPPVWKRSELTPFPFKMELIPMSPAYLYDLERLEQEEVDLERNLLWYRVPSLESVVFFKWVPASPATIISDREDDDKVKDDGSDDEKEELFTLQPCSYKVSLAFYQRLLSSDSREDFQARFMRQIGVEQTPLMEGSQRDFVYESWLETEDTKDDYPVPLPTPPEDDDLEGEGSDPDTFEVSLPSSSILPTPNSQSRHPALQKAHTHPGQLNEYLSIQMSVMMKTIPGEQDTNLNLRRARKAWMGSEPKESLRTIPTLPCGINGANGLVLEGHLRAYVMNGEKLKNEDKMTISIIRLSSPHPVINRMQRSVPLATNEQYSEGPKNTVSARMRVYRHARYHVDSRNNSSSITFWFQQIRPRSQLVEMANAKKHSKYATASLTKFCSIKWARIIDPSFISKSRSNAEGKDTETPGIPATLYTRVDIHHEQSTVSETGIDICLPIIKAILLGGACGVGGMRVNK